MDRHPAAIDNAEAIVQQRRIHRQLITISVLALLAAGLQCVVLTLEDYRDELLVGSRPGGMGGGPMGMGGGMPGGDGSRLELLIPGNKVGLVIGKGGETIRQLQVCIL